MFITQKGQTIAGAIPTINGTAAGSMTIEVGEGCEIFCYHADVKRILDAYPIALLKQYYRQRTHD